MRVLVCGHNDDGQIRTITLFFAIVYRDEGEVYKSAEEASGSIVA